MKLLIVLVLVLTGCCHQAVKPEISISFERELKEKKRSWIPNYKYRSGVTLLPSSHLKWLEKEARKKNRLR